MLGLYLGIPMGLLEAMEVDNHTVSKMSRELVKG